MSSSAAAPQQSGARAIAIAALLIAIGNIASRVIGLVREASIAYFFALGIEADAFTLAWTIPNLIYDLLINGAVSAALVPILSEYAEGDENEFGRLVSAVFTVGLGLLTALLALATWQAPLLVSLLVQEGQAGLRPLTIELTRALMPAIFLMGISGLATAVLHARRRFLAAAFVGAAFNSGLIVGMVLFQGQLGINSLAVGALIGGIVQVAIQIPGLRSVRWQGGGWNHPGLKRIIILYAPVLIGIGFSIVGTTIDRYLASGLAAAPATMRYATTLIQFPLGLVAAAVSLAVLPTLSRQSAANDETAFRRTLAMGLKVVLLLVIPATAGLALLAEPLTALLLERGAFSADDTPLVALALRFYLPGLPAAALDQVLLFAFYARKNTLTPNLVQGAAIGFYLVSALPLLWLSELGFLALVLGNSVQWIGHALLLWWLLRRTVPLGGLGLGAATGKGVLAALAMAGVLYGLLQVGASWPALVQIGVGAVVGGAVYLGLSMALRVEALDYFTAALRARLRR